MTVAFFLHLKNIYVFSMERHINDVCRVCYHHLRNISLMRKKLTTDSMKTLVQAFILSRLDMHNALYSGLPNILLDKLQRVQNSAARLISGVPRRARMTPVLGDLHWLPIRQRILFKLCVMVFKAVTDCAPQYIVDLLVRHNP